MSMTPVAIDFCTMVGVDEVWWDHGSPCFPSGRRWLGRIVNISSPCTHRGVPRMTHYIAAKFGVSGISKALALGFGRCGRLDLGPMVQP